MIFQFSREARSWDLVADTGELIGTATAIPGDCWAIQMTPLFGGGKAWATDPETAREWMETEAKNPR
jgi:hypothetical protein